MPTHLIHGLHRLTFFASAEEGGVSRGADWGVAFWSHSMSVAYLTAAIILSANRPGTVMFGLVVAGLAQSAETKAQSGRRSLWHGRADSQR